jgi:hypothetical protein
MNITMNITAKPSILALVRVRWMLRLGVMALIFSLLACSNNDGLGDLRAFTESERAKKPSEIEPLPNLRPTEISRHLQSYLPRMIRFIA